MFCAKTKLFLKNLLLVLVLGGAGSVLLASAAGLLSLFGVVDAPVVRHPSLLPVFAIIIFLLSFAGLVFYATTAYCCMAAGLVNKKGFYSSAVISAIFGGAIVYGVLTTVNQPLGSLVILCASAVGSLFIAVTGIFHARLLEKYLGRDIQQAFSGKENHCSGVKEQQQVGVNAQSCTAASSMQKKDGCMSGNGKLSRKDRINLITILIAILLFMIVHVDDIGANLAECQIANSPSLSLCMRAKGYVFDTKGNCKPDNEQCYRAYSWFNKMKEN